MKVVLVIIIGLIAVGFGGIYLPCLFVNQAEKFTREEFIRINPEFDWLKSDLILEFVWFTCLMIGIASGIYLFQHKPMSLGLFSLLPAGLAFANGLMTVKTGICRVPYQFRGYLYVFDESLRKVGLIQLSIALAVILAAVALVLLPNLTD